MVGTGSAIRQCRCAGGPEIVKSGGHAYQLGLVQSVQDALEDLLAKDLYVIQHPSPAIGDPDEDDASVRGDAVALHEASLLHPIDDASGAGDRDIQHLGQVAHRHLAVAVEQVHDVELGHADALAEEAFAADTLELTHRRPEVGDDRGLGDGPRGARGRGDGSWHVNHHIHPNHLVNADHPHEREDMMRFVLMIEPQQGLTYGEQVAIAKAAEANGFEGLFRSDHYASFPGEAGRPTTDAWAVLAGLARETDRITLGALISPVTFRHPGNFAKVVTTVDEMSGGRIEVGVGAGWNELEHRQLGLPFPPIKERADLLEDQLAILLGLWGEPDGWSFQGHQVTIDNARFQPKPVDVPGRPRTAIGGARPRLLVGGSGSPRSYRIAARYADEFNLSSASPDHAREVFAALDAACEAIGRDPATLSRSIMAGVLIGRDDAEVARRVEASMRAFGSDADGEAWLAERLTRWVTGTPEQARAVVRRFAEVGADRIMLQDFLPWDLDMIDVMGEVLIGQV